MIRVLIVDDHDGVRRSVGLVLGLEPDIAVVGEAADGLVGLRQAHELRPDVIVLDLGMPRLGGLEVMRLLRPVLPDVRIVAFSSDVALRGVALACGASCFVEKGAAPGELVGAIRNAVVARPTLTTLREGSAIPRAG